MCTNTVCDNQNTYSQKNLWLVTNFFQFFRPLFASPSEHKLKKLSSFYLSRSFRVILFSLAPSNIFSAFSFPSPGKRADRLSPFCFFPRLLLWKAPPLFRIPIWPDKDWLSQTTKVHDLDCIRNITTLKNRKITKICPKIEKSWFDRHNFLNEGLGIADQQHWITFCVWNFKKFFSYEI